MHLSTFIFGLPLLASICSATPHFKRAILDDVMLYAYGTNISGYGLAYGDADGLAYITTAPSANYSYLTVDISNTGSVAWNGTINDVTSVGSFFIINEGSTFAQVGFITSNSTSSVSANASTIGFSIFGDQVVYIDATGYYLSQFWAQKTDVDGVWSLLWNSDGASQIDSVPVTIKTTGLPTSG